ncbi:hypothetical protein QBC44DRAFT_376264 [Cladorrhinum sp. PSN332]|nr:hypothetical protein QBC44DRAFT_376264 [Cladorrhinum sp. PSN332]
MTTALSYSEVQQRDSFEVFEETRIPNSSNGTLPRRQHWAWQYLFGISLLANAVLALFLVSPIKYPDSNPAEDDCRRLRTFEDVYDDVSSTIKCSTVRYDTGPSPDPPDFKAFWGRHWFEGSEDDINLLWRQLSSGETPMIHLESLAVQAAILHRLTRSTCSPASEHQRRGGFKAPRPHSSRCRQARQNYVRNHALGLPQMHNDETSEERRIHVEHCLGLLRQSLLCEGNLQPIVYTTLDGEPQANPGATPRHCRNWGALWEWARERNITTGSVKPNA